MKTVLIIVAMSFLFVACGKSNSTGGDNSNTFVNPLSSSQVSNITDFSTFKQAVKNNNFVSQGYTDVKYYGTKQTITTNKNVVDLFIIKIPYSISTGGNSSSVYRQYNSVTGSLIHESKATTIATLTSYLGNILDQAVNYYPCQQGGCFVVYSNGFYYAIDLKWPIAANPVQIASSAEIITLIGYQVIQQ